MQLSTASRGMVVEGELGTKSGSWALFTASLKLQEGVKGSAKKQLGGLSHLQAYK